ncbi:MAG: flagellar basal body rod modification protein [Limimaricola sp.]|uniref:flagellar hook capping FlgD N-terminal domain-containing protein n=1 Tax=Limimaricola sp. TaxID=2211665 RepID=UPI001D9D4F2A|nr:flagellar hook capping FlgD N-terminal domain-containing protein [Limimaricola sp.]MBI1417324.1 flagellar basal body rod modification protein [Limimaricola sp.]
MTVTPTTMATSAAAPAAPAAAAGSKLSSDFDTFLKMLTVQMKNQDPLNPVNSADYAVQLATFSGVEQQVKTNDLLTSLTGQLGTSGLGQAAGWVGREVRAPGAALFTGAPVTVWPVPPDGADSAQLVVTDSTGAEVDRLAVPATADPVQWSGIGADGMPVAPGPYTFTLRSTAAGNPLPDSVAEVYAKVQEVQLQQGQPILVLQGGSRVSPNEISALRDAGPG